MSVQCATSLIRKNLVVAQEGCSVLARLLHTTAVCNRTCSARYRPIQGRQQLLTYDMANPPHLLTKRKSWNSWNTTSLKGGLRSQLTTIEDMFIRKFMTGTWHNLIPGDQVIIKRQHNIVRIACILHRKISCGQMYFLLGFSEEMLSIWLQCPVKLEIQTADPSEGYVKII